MAIYQSLPPELRPHILVSVTHHVTRRVTMIKKASIAFTLFSLASSALAQWEVTASYSQFDLDQGLSFDLGAAVLGAGYSFPITESLTLTPIVRIGYGVKDDDFPWYVGSVQNGQPIQYKPSAEISVDQYYGLQVRGEFQLSDRAYIFVAPSFSVIETKISVDYRSVGLNSPDYHQSDDADGFGIGAGAGFKFNDLMSAELAYEQTDLDHGVELNTLSAQLRFFF